MAVLKSGSKGGPVKKLQEQLNKAGSKPKLSADGLFGPLTTEAVKAFQKKSKLKADGIAGAKTEAALGGGKGGGGAGGGKAGGASGGKAGGGGLPKDAWDRFVDVSGLFYDLLDDCDAAASGIEKVHKGLKGKSGLSDQEKAKQLKPLTALFAKAENSQRKFVTALPKVQKMMGEIDQKSTDRNAKKLIKLGQTLNGSAKGFVGYSKSTKQRSAAFLKEFAKDPPRSAKEAKKSYHEIYLDSKPAAKLIHVWYNINQTLKKAA